MECIKEVRDRAGWVIYRRPPASTEPIAEGNFSQKFPRCSECRAAHPRGLVYCCRCHRVLDGEVKHNIHDKSGNRGDDSEVSEIHQNVILTLKRLDDPAGPFRGARQ